MTTQHAVCRFHVVDDLAAILAGTESVYRMMSDAEPQWACVDGQVADRTDVRFASGEVIYDGVQEDGTTTGSYLVALWFTVPAEATEKYEEWYRTEHGPMLLREPTWLRSRQIRIDSSTTDATHLVLHDLADMSALSSEALVAAQQAPGRVYHAAQEWFTKNTTQVFVKL